MTHDIKAVSAAFDIEGPFVSGGPYGTGHINDTYAVTFDQAQGPTRYILQRINHDVFKDPVQVMENIGRVTQHLRNKLTAAGVDDSDRRTLTLIPTRDGASYHVDTDGHFWRIYIFIEDAQTYDELETTHQAFEAAKAFGAFMKQLADLPGGPLAETIPAFHDTRARFDTLQAAIEADVCNRAADVAAEIAFANQREPMVDTLLDLQRAGRIPLVTTHNDTKLNNVMLDDATGEGICVIDLDTVMPGLALYDFGDMVRTAMRPCPEDETDLSKVVGRIEMFEAITQGYLATAGDALNATELDHLAFSARLITFEIGIRFLTDYLQGDVYFKTHRDGQNLDRTRVQFTMVKSMEQQADAMEQIVDTR
ncbi:MAG: aminoglycoside phosphotransferase family protein [Kiritimatiellia bacterium]|jgi:Ser/Thr protein kinase RdoA (MazF antagonist)|nr:aminoglycoside phosphotransferase family protein [Kiritimatiellia bacterium]